MHPGARRVGDHHVRPHPLRQVADALVQIGRQEVCVGRVVECRVRSRATNRGGHLLHADDLLGLRRQQDRQHAHAAVEIKHGLGARKRRHRRHDRHEFLCRKRVGLEEAVRLQREDRAVQLLFQERLAGVDVNLGAFRRTADAVGDAVRDAHRRQPARGEVLDIRRHHVRLTLGRDEQYDRLLRVEAMSEDKVTEEPGVATQVVERFVGRQSKRARGGEVGVRRRALQRARVYVQHTVVRPGSVQPEGEIASELLPGTDLLARQPPSRSERELHLVPVAVRSWRRDRGGHAYAVMARRCEALLDPIPLQL